MPGGHLEGDETPQDAAIREWQEETGLTLPEGAITGGWESANGIYVGFVYTVACEADVPILDGRDLNSNPDVDGDSVEALAWWTPQDMVDNPVVRDELSADMVAVLDCLGGSGDGEPVVKAASPWEAHPVRAVEGRLATAHAGPVGEALAGSVTRDALRSLAAAYVAAQPKDGN
jgi:ADP-ribose pyrophosphatase YjhB (NUDIX family)